MRHYLKPLIFALLLTALGYAMWPLLQSNLAAVKLVLLEFRHFCRVNPMASYAIFASVMAGTVLLGLPLATLLMLFAGLVYGFWEAAALVTLSRVAAAFIAFILARALIEETDVPVRQKPYLLRRFEQHPCLSLFIARLAPLPDSVVNYAIAASPIRHRDYIAVSLVGMVPVTLACVWLGEQMGTISRLLNLLH